eukprot:753492-Hanusia_phi.AAC.5
MPPVTAGGVAEISDLLIKRNFTLLFIDLEHDGTQTVRVRRSASLAAESRSRSSETEELGKV